MKNGCLYSILIFIAIAFYINYLRIDAKPVWLISEKLTSRKLTLLELKSMIEADFRDGEHFLYVLPKDRTSYISADRFNQYKEIFQVLEITGFMAIKENKQTKTVSYIESPIDNEGRIFQATKKLKYLLRKPQLVEYHFEKDYQFIDTEYTPIGDCWYIEVSY
jgi:hypothetical protein